MQYNNTTLYFYTRYKLLLYWRRHSLLVYLILPCWCCLYVVSISFGTYYYTFPFNIFTLNEFISLFLVFCHRENLIQRTSNCLKVFFQLDLSDVLQELGPVRTSWTATWLSTPRTSTWDAPSPQLSGSRPREDYLGCRFWLCHMRAPWKSPVTWKAWRGAHLTTLQVNRGRLSPSVDSCTVMFQPRSSRRGSRSWQGGTASARRGPRWWGSPPVSAEAWQS